MKIEIETEKGHKFEWDIDWEKGEKETHDNERKMGTEYVHHCPVSIICPECGQLIDKVDVYEYPEGAVNYAEGRYATTSKE
ncbi:MAG: hypothetical protein SOY26_08330 [Paludibacteraceae bacterium]|nr:hypothetical protein [Bacteroidales bacterium]MDY4149731.1 hypothetical protein [Paludibacteraceae bacterium]